MARRAGLKNFQTLDGRHYTRLAIPAPLRPYLDGKSELRHAHGDSFTVAERNHNAVIARFLDKLDWARAKHAADHAPAKAVMRDRPMSLGEFARGHYASQLQLDAVMRDHLPAFARIGIDDTYVSSLREIRAGTASDEQIEATIGDIIGAYRQRGHANLAYGSPGYRSAARDLAGVEYEALSRMAERDDGDPEAEPTHRLLTEAEPAAALQPKGDAVSILGLLAGYLKELAKSGGGAEAGKRWTPGFKNFVRFLGHDDARLISKQNVLDWKDELLEELSPKTVRDTNIAALRAVLTWAIDNRKLPEGTTNPAAGIKIRVTKKTLDRPKGFTLDEAHAILKAARAYQPAHSDNPATRESEHVTAAKRWTPWLCAFSGARISEMTQLRTQDIMTEDGVTFMRITPDAGSVKTGKFRDVPLHRQLVELGFLDFVKRAEPGPLFFNGKTARRGTRHASKYAAQRMAMWIREVVPSIPMEVQPNHGWRHRFKSVSFGLDVNSRVIDAIEGHAAKTAGDNYGDVDISAKAKVIAKFPHYDLSHCIGGDAR
ncbi:tyrosine-type recombinase/integrase [Methylopila sp. 73B]|uniref:tyrosine-type recombinase/integrase n=1 Tax=Methylopila sp. 73B TaxID=1120792 RepID=UPI0003738A5B|nr:tyrosine-type recombinase/integrase [Methylopila sp. 73B]